MSWLPFCPCQLWKTILSLLSLQNLFIFGAFVLGIIVILIIVSRLTSDRLPNIVIYKSERFYVDPQSGERHPLPQLGTTLLSKDTPTYADLAAATLYLSVIIPAYNEETRLPVMLDEAFGYLESRKCRYELIVVDDGSKDRTTEVALDYVQKYGSEKIRVITLEKNRGKGGAIRIGILAARGEFCLFADADGATKFSDVKKLEEFIFTKKEAHSEKEATNESNNWDPLEHSIAIGSRSHLAAESIARRSFFRTILMYGFHMGVRLLTVRTVKDTQCGFKLMPRRIAHILFTHSHIERWAFDVEILLLAERLKIPIGEIPVRWTEIDGSKLVPFFSWLQMGKDVFLIFWMYATGAYKYPTPPFDGPILSLSRNTKKAR